VLKLRRRAVPLIASKHQRETHPGLLEHLGPGCRADQPAHRAIVLGAAAYNYRATRIQRWSRKVGRVGCSTMLQRLIAVDHGGWDVSWAQAAAAGQGSLVPCPPVRDDQGRIASQSRSAARCSRAR